MPTPEQIEHDAKNKAEYDDLMAQLNANKVVYEAAVASNDAEKAEAALWTQSDILAKLAKNIGLKRKNMFTPDVRYRTGYVRGQ